MTQIQYTHKNGFKATISVFGSLDNIAKEVSKHIRKYPLEVIKIEITWNSHDTWKD